jgi:hypothetical protein
VPIALNRFAIESRKWKGDEECDVAGIAKHYASNKEIFKQQETRGKPLVSCVS